MAFEHSRDGLLEEDRRSLRIGIATSGRFHVLDLARELAALGHQVRLYSMLPDGRVEKFGLARRYHRSLLPFVAPLVAWHRYAPRAMPDWHSWIFARALDRAVMHVLEPCDVFICMSGIYIEAARHAGRAYGAQVWLERGSRHILSQAEILAAVPGVRRPPADIIIRELEGYRIANRIVVPSRHVAESFARDQEAAAKLFVNPYGTSLEMFPYLEREYLSTRPLRLVFAGSWSRRKGCDVLEQAVSGRDEVLLQHVGNIGDQPFPWGNARFAHRDTVPQSELAPIYHSNDAFVHPSREEGLSVVLAQALASGLPIICTDRTGGEDLAHTPRLRSRITTVPHDDPVALQEAIETQRKKTRDGTILPALEDADRATLSWAAYAKRYDYELLACTADRAKTAAPSVGAGGCPAATTA